jgi:hypothetical protein
LPADFNITKITKIRFPKKGEARPFRLPRLFCFCGLSVFIQTGANAPGLLFFWFSPVYSGVFRRFSFFLLRNFSIAPISRKTILRE